jgi:hypothetical protein
MARLLIHVEGQTEETFVNEILRPHLMGCGFQNVSARMLGNARARSRRGGIIGWDASHADIARHLQGDEGAYSTTLVDFYGLPATGAKRWPGRDSCPNADPIIVHNHLQTEISNDFVGRYGAIADRFVPFVAFHEFEGLLFSNPAAMADGMNCSHLAPAFQTIRDGFASPEHINDSPITAPSKRIMALVPGYQKPLHGVLAALQVTLPGMRGDCPAFDAWLQQLEALP